MNKFLSTPTALALAHTMGRMGATTPRRGLYFDKPTVVQQSTANTAALIDNPAYKLKYFNDYGPFDTLPFERNNAQYGFFQQGIGANGKTSFETNMINGGQFPLGRNVVVTGIGFHLCFSGAAASTRAAQIQALYTVLENSYVNLKIEGRDFEFQAPGSYWLPEIAWVGDNNLASTAEDVATAFQRVGDYVKHGGYKLSQFITLQNLIPFSLQWYVNLQNAATVTALETLTPNGAAAARMRWQFLGRLSQAA